MSAAAEPMTMGDLMPSATEANSLQPRSPNVRDQHAGYWPAATPQTMVVWQPGVFVSPPRPLPNEVLSELAAVHAEAHDEGFEPPSDKAVKTARRLLEHIPIASGRCDVYPTPDAEVAISVPGDGRGQSVLVLCGSDGSVWCSVNLEGRHRRAYYDEESFQRLSDDFLWAALRDLYGPRQIWLNRTAFSGWVV